LHDGPMQRELRLFEQP